MATRETTAVNDIVAKLRRKYVMSKLKKWRYNDVAVVGTSVDEREADAAINAVLEFQNFLIEDS